MVLPVILLRVLWFRLKDDLWALGKFAWCLEASGFRFLTINDGRQQPLQGHGCHRGLFTKTLKLILAFVFIVLAFVLAFIPRKLKILKKNFYCILK